MDCWDAVHWYIKILHFNVRKKQQYKQLSDYPQTVVA